MKRCTLIALACTLIACARTPTATTKTAEAIARGNPASSSDGGRVYVTNCSSCHGLDGKGLPGAFPPLAANPAVTGDPRRVIAVVLFGQRGK
ncbi:MAG: cytochrome c, partial [Candidatus Eremiobacteraeota bacterium]|nr:cytochrome c [Candidatus Eremiobacteraeota bacterium]